MWPFKKKRSVIVEIDHVFCSYCGQKMEKDQWIYGDPYYDPKTGIGRAKQREVWVCPEYTSYWNDRHDFIYLTEVFIGRIENPYAT